MPSSDGTPSECFMSDGSHIRISESQTGGLDIDVHVIGPGWGSSGYYSEAVLRKACDDGVYPEGMHMHIDHPSRSAEEEQPARTLQGASPLAAIFSRPGTYESNGWDGAGVYTQATVLPAFVEDIRAMAGHIGVSHYVSGLSEMGEAEGRKGHIITELLADPLNTVDFVTVPGAGGHYRTLGEALASHRNHNQETDMTDTPPAITLESVKGDPKLMEALRAEIMKEADSAKLAEQLTAAQTKNTELTESLADARAKLIVQEGRTYALAKVAESKLPAPSQKRVVESLAFGEIPDQDSGLDTVAFDKTIEAAIAAEQAYIDEIIKESGTGTVHDLGGGGGGGGPVGDDAAQMYYEALIRAGKSADIAKKMAGVD